MHIIIMPGSILNEETREANGCGQKPRITNAGYYSRSESHVVIILFALRVENTAGEAERE